MRFVSLLGPPALILPPLPLQSFTGRSYRTDDTPVGNAFRKWRTVARSSGERLISAMQFDSMSSRTSCVSAARTFDTTKASAHKTHSFAVSSLVSKTVFAASQAISRSPVDKTVCISTSTHPEVVCIERYKPNKPVGFCRSFVRTSAELIWRRGKLKRLFSRFVLSTIKEISSRIISNVPSPYGMNGQARARQDRGLRLKFLLPTDLQHGPGRAGLRSG